MNELKEFFKEHQEWVLGFFALMLFLMIIGFFVWGVTLLVNHFATALSPPPEVGEDVRFHLQEARQLNLRGLSGQQ